MVLELQSTVHVEGNIQVVLRGRHQRTVISAIGMVQQTYDVQNCFLFHMYKAWLTS